MTPIPELALASIRHGVEDRPAAAIATATLHDYGIITETDLSQVIDASKVRRAKQNCMLESQDRATLQNQEEEIICLFFDGRRDRTKVMLFNEQTGKFTSQLRLKNTTVSPKNLQASMPFTSPERKPLRKSPMPNRMLLELLGGWLRTILLIV